MKSGLSLRAAIVFAAAVAAACATPEPARLVAAIEGPAVADALFFHGNCFAGWQLRVDLRMRETGGTAVWIEHLDYGVVDAGLGVTIAPESLDSTTLEDRHGTSLIPANGSVIFPLGGPSGTRPVGPIVLTGAVRGRDENARPTSTSFRLTAPSLVVHDEEPGRGGACSPP